VAVSPSRPPPRASEDAMPERSRASGGGARDLRPSAALAYGDAPGVLWDGDPLRAPPPGVGRRPASPSLARGALRTVPSGPSGGAWGAGPRGPGAERGSLSGPRPNETRFTQGQTRSHPWRGQGPRSFAWPLLPAFPGLMPFSRSRGRPVKGSMDPEARRSSRGPRRRPSARARAGRGTPQGGPRPAAGTGPG